MGGPQTLNLVNRFRGLNQEEIIREEAHVNPESTFRYQQNEIKSQSLSNRNRANPIRNLHPERDIIAYGGARKKTLAGNSMYSNTTQRGKKVMIFSDSICKPIDMVKFEKELNDNIAVKRFFLRWSNRVTNGLLRETPS